MLPALKQAAEIGVRTCNNPAGNAANKDAILVLSFGTTYKDSREKTIDKTVSDIRLLIESESRRSLYVAYHCRPH